MKHIKLFLLNFILILCLAACGTTPGTESTDSGTVQPDHAADAGMAASDVTGSVQPGMEGNALIAYFAYSENIGDTSGMTADAIASASLGQSTGNESGNLQVIAQTIQEQTGGDVHSILVTEPYDPVYEVMRDRAYDEMDNGILPELQSQTEGMDQYDIVYLGMPVWAGQMPAPVAAFLTENDLAGKTILPFSINLGSGFGHAKSQIEELCPDAVVMDAFTVRADADNDDVRLEVRTWLEEADDSGS